MIPKSDADLHLYMLDEICTCAALGVEEEDGTSSLSSTKTKEDGSKNRLSQSIESLLTQTESLFMFAYIWRRFLKLGEYLRDDEGRSFISDQMQQMAAEVGSLESVNLNVDNMLKKLKSVPDLAKGLLKLFEKDCFVPNKYDATVGQTIIDIASEMGVDAEELFEMNREMLKNKGFSGMFKTFRLTSHIRRPTKLTTPTVLDMEMKRQLDFANSGGHEQLVYRSRLLRAFEDVMANNLKDAEFPCVNKRMVIPNGKMKPRVIVFVLGGVSWYEFLQLTESAKKADQPITVMSSRFFNGPGDYLKSIARLAS